MRDLFWRFVKAILFRLDAEQAHRLTVALIRLGSRMGGIPLRIVSGAPNPRTATENLVRLWDLEFRSRVGLAAGFDKDAEMVEGLPSLGFGFAEIGTVTPRPQPGNDQPRLFRAPTKQSLFNRMGFNGLGAEIVRAHLTEALPKLPPGFRIGVNIGKNKDTSNEDAASDYLRAAAAFEGLADYLVINVSSPNTPGLRALQSAEALKPIIEGVNGRITGWKRRPPLLLKLAPEIRGEDLRLVLDATVKWGIDGFVLTNTLGGTWPSNGLPGGWSGAVLTEGSRSSLQEARSFTRKPIISVGGILSEDEAAQRLRLGADLIQLYSGWIYRGPSFPPRVVRATLKI